jgi:hypothetical protein
MIRLGWVHNEELFVSVNSEGKPPSMLRKRKSPQILNYHK